MKKFLIFIFILSIAFTLFACDHHKINNGFNLPKYNSEECYWDEEGFRDYTDFCKYFYDQDSVKIFETHSKFKKVQSDDIENIISYFENFDGWFKSFDYYDKFDFDYQTQVKEGDYYCIVTEEDNNDKFENYDIYYVDMTNYILYFIHSNT